MIPNLICMAPRDEFELPAMMRFALEQKGPVAIRYPRGAGVGARVAPPLAPLVLGRSEVLREGNDAVVWAVGNTLHPALVAAERLAAAGMQLTVINPRFIKPLDLRMLEAQLLRRLPMISCEEGALAGGFGSMLLEAAHDLGQAPTMLRIGLPDQFATQGTPAQLRALYRLDAGGITEQIREFLTARAASPRRIAAV